MRGRPRKHAARHMLDGTFRPARHDEGADNLPSIGDCAPTRELNEHGDAFFRSVVSAYPPGTLGESDSEALTQCSEWVERMHQVRQLEKETGVPATKLAAEASKNFLQFAVRFGLTPADRGKVKTGAGAGESKEQRFFGVTG